MNFLEKLLDGVAVEWKALGEVMSKITDGSHNPPKASGNGKYPMISAKNINNGQIDFDDARMLSQEDYEQENKRTRASVGDVLMTIVGSVGRVAVIKIDMAMTFQRSVCIMCPLSKIVHSDFVKYYLETKSMQNELAKQANGSAQKGLYLNQIKDLKIPIPCPDNPEKSLAIQAEIVRILDTFTALTAELTAELTDRQKQYNYYRDRSLTFEEGEAEWKTLGEASLKSYSGGTPTAGTSEYYDGGTIPWLRTQEVKFSDIEKTEIKITPSALKNSAVKWIPENCVIIAISGATAGRSAINKIPLTTNQHCCCLEIDPEKALYRYVFHWVNLNYENLKGLGQGARGDLNSGIIKGFKIPIPYSSDPQKSLEEQARIVAILDKFDAIANSIREGLPREIALRQKQYEYYRDLLLTFPKPEEVEAHLNSMEKSHG